MMRLLQYRFKKWPKRAAIRLFDFLGKWVTRPQLQVLFPQPEKILVIRNDHLGDVILTWPALGTLKKYFPQARMDFLVSQEVAPLFSSSKLFRKIIPHRHHWFSKSSFSQQWTEYRSLLKDIKNEKYDLGIDFRGDLRNIWLMHQAGITRRLSFGITGGGFLLTDCPDYPDQKHQTESIFDLLKILGIHELPIRQPLEFNDKKIEKILIKFPMLSQKDRGPRAILHAGAGYSSKRWNPSHYQEIIRRLQKSNVQIILIGTENEKKEIPVSVENYRYGIDLRGETTLEDLMGIFAFSDFYIGNDSGPAHLAAMQGLPLVIVFSGTNQASQWRPWTEKLKLITYSVPCSPCEARDCPLHHHDCMNKISVELVWTAIEQTLQNIQGQPREV